MNSALSNIIPLLILPCSLPIRLFVIIQIKGKTNNISLTTLIYITTLVVMANLVILGVEIPPLLAPSQKVLIPHAKCVTNLTILLSTIITSLLIMPFKMLLCSLYKAYLFSKHTALDENRCPDTPLDH